MRRAHAARLTSAVALALAAVVPQLLAQTRPPSPTQIASQQELDRAIQIDPAYPRPYVVKGVIEARSGRYQEAIALWKKARSIDPEYPGIDDLIAEAEKRKAGAR